MKKSIVLLLFLFGSLGIIMAQSDKNKKKKVVVATVAQPNLDFEKIVHDFGNIKEGIHATVVFVFENTGNAPLIITSVLSSGSTYALWPHEPIEPGLKGKITVVYNSNGRPGNFTKTITVKHNGETEGGTVYLTIKGIVEPIQIPPILVFDKYEHDFGIVDEGILATTDFYFINSGNVPIEITRVDASSGCITPTWPLGLIAPGVSEKITVVYNSNGNNGVFKKTLFVKYKKLDEDENEVLTIKGTVETAPY